MPQAPLTDLDREIRTLLRSEPTPPSMMRAGVRFVRPSFLFPAAGRDFQHKSCGYRQPLVAFCFGRGGCERGTLIWRRRPPFWLQIASPSLLGATVLLPGGFFLGGLFIYSGDPGFGALLIPVGAALLIASVGLTVLAIFRPKPADQSDP